MSCQRNSTQVCQAAVFSGIPASTSKFVFVSCATAAAYNTASFISSGRRLIKTAADPTMSNLELGWQAGATMFHAVCASVNITLSISGYRALQDRKKLVTKYVIMDATGNEVGWSYNSDTVADKLKMYKGRGTTIVQVQEKVDFAQIRKFLRVKNFQEVEQKSH